MSNISKLTIHAVGDVMLGEGPYYLDRGVRTAIQKKGFQYPFKKINTLLGSADLVIGNMEAACSTKGESLSLRSRTFRGPDEGAKALRYGGFTVMTLANNHFLTHGRDAAADSFNQLKEAGIKTVGWSPEKSDGKDAAIGIIEIKGSKIALLALCDVPTSLPDGSKRADFPGMHEQWVFDSIGELKSKGYMVIINAHWGAEYIDRPDPLYVSLARRWIDQGADLILGHGPHALQGYEMRNGRPIIFSMGNFLFDQHFWDKTSTSAIFRIETDGTSFDLMPVPVKYDHLYQVVALNGEEKDRVINYLKDLCCQINSSGHCEKITVGDDYQAAIEQAYQQMRSRYLRYMFVTVNSLTIRSALALIRDMFTRLTVWLRFRYLK